MEQEYLVHHGILGMKWGIRRFQNKNGSLTAAGKKRAQQDSEEASDDYKKARTSKSMKSMSNKELRDYIDRVNLESQYANIQKQKRPAVVKFVSDVLANAGKQVATKYTANYIDKGLQYIIRNSSNKAPNNSSNKTNKTNNGPTTTGTSFGEETSRKPSSSNTKTDNSQWKSKIYYTNNFRDISNR